MFKRIICVLLSFELISTINTPVFAKQAVEKITADRQQVIEKLKSISKDRLKLNEKNGQVFLSGKLSNKQQSNEKSAINFLEENKALFSIENAENELRFDGIKEDKNGDTFVKFIQVINGIKVNGSSINVHYDKNGVIVSVNGKLSENKQITTLGNKDISEKDAIGIAKKQFNYKSLRNIPKVEKLILTKDAMNYEVYKVNISYMEPTVGNSDVFVEAHSGNVIQVENNIRFDGPVTGSGIDVLGNVKNLNLYLKSGSYQMDDATNSASKEIDTYSLNNGITAGTMVSNTTNYFSSEKDKASVSAHYNAERVIDFYKNLFNRNSLDDEGMIVESYTHYGTGYNNAFWDGYEMVYGDGDGTTFTYLSGDLGVVGHEMTHAVIDNTANLQYHNQSGALNESMADVFGVLISTYNKYNAASGGTWVFNASDWVMGKDIYTPHVSGDALRSLSNPKLYGQPDNMSNYQNASDTQAGDWGGVHANSGIPNKAAYLIANNIGMEKTARIYYRALVNYMNMYTDFAGAMNCLEQAAVDLYGDNSAEVTAVDNAFSAVGVKQSLAVQDFFEPNDTFQTAYPINSGAEYQSYISTSTDVDYYSLNVNSPGVINISLWNLPADYDMELYDYNGQRIAASYNDGATSESISYNVSGIGNYYIKVFGYSSDFSDTQKYSLMVTRPVAGISLNKTSLILKVGQSISLSATFSPIDATNKSVIWSSSNTNVATVDGHGNVTALSSGAVTITASTVDGNKKASCDLNISQIIISFDLYGGSSISTEAVNYNSLIAQPVMPTKPNYTFNGWYKESNYINAWNFAVDRATQDTTLYGKWTETAQSKAIGDFVTRLYEQCLNREPDLDGLNYWKDKLLSRTDTGADVAANFIFSQEFVNGNVSDESFINIMYKSFFNRTPDDGGKSYWLNKLSNGISRYYILASFVNSQEFNALCASYTIDRGSIVLTKPVDLHPDVTAFTNRFYVKCLGRNADESGLSYWVTQLVSGQNTSANLANGFVFSSEFTSKNLSNSDFVAVMYRVFFDREADAGGEAYWVNIMNSGKSRKYVLANFVNSQEFRGICNSYGIVPGNIIQ